jgi:tetratricopeptide (TPR) repeat protein
MNATPASSSPSPVETALHRIRKLMERSRFTAALAATKALAVQVPENRDVLYMRAVCLRYLGRIPDALAALEQLERLHPRFSGLHQERGHCYVDLRDAPRAIEAYLLAVNINVALPASWAKLQGLYRMIGNRENTAMAADHVATLKNLPADVVTATALFADGDLAPAESLIRAYLRMHPHNVEAMRLLARIGIAHDVLDDAEVLLAAVLELAPDYRKARFEYARVLLDRHKHTRAMEELEKLLAQEPENRQFKTLFAAACVGIGANEKALGLYRQLLSDAPQAAELHLSIAHSLKTLGRHAESIDAYRAASAARPDYGDAYWSLANLKTYRFPDDELARMLTEEQRPGIAPVDRYHLCFALGKALEDRGDYEKSYRHYERGNQLKHAEMRYRPEIIERNTRMQIDICTRELFERRKGVGSRQADPIFIVGLPRSGSTLLEQILASHSRVEGTHELADIPRIVHELQGREQAGDAEPRYPRVLEDLSAEELLRLGEKYLSDTRVYRTDRPFFIDKMPNNFRHLGLIHLLLPNARIIDARREPMACCFSNFKQLFASGQEFTYGIEDIARYYRTYLELMEHWNAALPGRILKMDHEDVVDDLDANVRRLLDFCGLDFESACLDFHKTARSVRTASSEQVRRPLFREGLDQWKNFEPWLGPLKTALGDALERNRD